METWKSSCRRYTVWEDALADGLIDVEKSEPVRTALVTLTERGKRMLNASV